MQKLITNTQNIMTKIKNRHLKYWDGNHLYGMAMSQKLPVDRLKVVKNTSEFI